MTESSWEWVKIPALITLLVTLVRLFGELMEGPQILFGSQAGGGGALIGITWLVPIFGIYFGYQLAGHGYAPPSLGKASGMLFAALAVLAVCLFIAFGLISQAPSYLTGLFLLVVVLPLVVWIAKKGWDELTGVMTAYAFAARIPVVVVAAITIFGGMKTHYSVGPPGFEGSGPFEKWILLGFFPQMSFWVMFTLIIGGLFACLGALFGRKKH